MVSDMHVRLMREQISLASVHKVIQLTWCTRAGCLRKRAPENESKRPKGILNPSQSRPRIQRKKQQAGSQIQDLDANNTKWMKCALIRGTLSVEVNESVRVYLGALKVSSPFLFNSAEIVQQRRCTNLREIWLIARLTEHLGDNPIASCSMMMILSCLLSILTRETTIVIVSGKS